MATNYEIFVRSGGQVATNLEFDNSIPHQTEFSSEIQSFQGAGKLVISAGIGLAKQSLNQHFSSVGAYTGNQEQQNEINNTIKKVNFGMSIVQGAVAGAVFGLHGAIGGAAVVVIQSAFDIVSQESDYNNQIRIENINRAYAREISIVTNNNKRSKGNS